MSWSFDKKGVIVLDAEDLDEDTVMMDALECGADDMQADDDVFEIYTSPDAFNDVVAGLEGKGYTFLEASVQMVPQNYVAKRTSRTWRSSWSSWRTTTTCRTSTTTGSRTDLHP